MKKTKFTESQIVKAIKEHEGGRKAEDMQGVRYQRSRFLQMASAVWRIGGSGIEEDE